MKHTAPQSSTKPTQISSNHPRVSTPQRACNVGLAQGVCVVYQNMFVTTVSTPTGSAGQSCWGNRCCREGDIHTIHGCFGKLCLGWVLVGVALFVCVFHLLVTLCLGFFCGRVWRFGVFVVICFVEPLETRSSSDLSPWI